MKMTEAAVIAVILTGVVAPAMSQAPAASSERTAAEVYAEAELRNSPDATAFVMVVLRPVPLREAGSERRVMVAQIQDRVLSDMAPGEFTVAYRYRNFPALAGRVTAGGLGKLAMSPDVIAVGPDARGTGQLDGSRPFIGADDVHNLGITGQGITVAVLDSGIDTDHPDLSDNIAAGAWHFLNQGADQGPGAEDDHGHGTSVSGIVTSKGTVAPLGIAPDADILAVKVLDSNNSGWLSDWAAGVDYVVSVKDDYDALCAINMSLASYSVYSQCPCDDANTYNQVLGAAIQAAGDAGIITFACSGNNGHCDQMSSPACLAAAVAVAAVYDEEMGREPDSGTYRDIFGGSFADCHDASTGPDLVTCFSNRSACNKLAAPGRLIVSTGIGGGSSAFTGTSQATPHCTAVAALMAEWAGSMTLTPEQVVQIMMDTGAPTIDPCGSAPNPVRIDALAAVTGIAGDGDANGDGVVDILDLAEFLACLTGPGGGPVGPDCRFADFHADDDVDLADFAEFQVAFDG